MAEKAVVGSSFGPSWNPHQKVHSASECPILYASYQTLADRHGLFISEDPLEPSGTDSWKRESGFGVC